VPEWVVRMLEASVRQHWFVWGCLNR